MPVEAAIRDATAGDRDAVVELVRSAFSDDSRDGHEEIDIVRATWSLGLSVQPIELVATVDDAIVGHALAAAGTVDESRLLALAPLAVLPEHHGQGIGSSLVVRLLDQAQLAGWPAVVLLGATAYYSRFGFHPAADAGIHYDVVGAGNPHFMVRELTSAALPKGSFTYCWEPAD